MFSAVREVYALLDHLEAAAQTNEALRSQWLKIQTLEFAGLVTVPLALAGSASITGPILLAGGAEMLAVGRVAGETALLSTALKSATTRALQSIPLRSSAMGQKLRAAFSKKPSSLPTQRKTAIADSTGLKPTTTTSAGQVKQVGDKVNGNSLQYVGETHVYSIKNTETGKYVKIGESMQGVNKYGMSKRAEVQSRRLLKETGVEHRTKIRRTFGSKAEARRWESKTIDKYRELHGSDKLPGNKGNR